MSARMSDALYEALLYGQDSTVLDIIRAGEDVNARDPSGCTALFYFAQCNRPEMVEALLSLGADPNARDNDTETVLMWAAGAGSNEAVQSLIAAGADIHARTDLDGTALRWAVSHGNDETVRILLEAGADPREPILLEAARYWKWNGKVKLLERRLKELEANWGQVKNGHSCRR